MEPQSPRRRGCRVGSKKKKDGLGKGIFNLTNIVFSKEEFIVLDKGIKFAPKKPFNIFETFIDLQRFIRKLNLKKHFGSKEKN